MKEVIGDIWKTNCDIICVTTNGVVKKNGKLVMGKGIALQAKQKFIGLDETLGKFVSIYGNIPEIVYCNVHTGNIITLVSLPTKHHWKNKSDIKLIKESLITIVEMTHKIDTIALPRPGCGNGGLKWEDVKKEIESILDDRFIVYSLEE